MLISLGNWPGKEGVWKIMVCQASLKVDLARPAETQRSWREVAISSLLKRDLQILPQRYTGHPITD
jgi:hypothetical protein